MYASEDAGACVVGDAYAGVEEPFAHEGASVGAVRI